MITFYSPKNPFGYLSNFSRDAIEYAGEVWQTSEHAFQAMKFWPHRPDLVTATRNSPGPMEAAEMGRNRSNPIRADWDLTPPTDMGEKVLDIPQPDDQIYRPGLRAEPLFARTKDVFMYDICLAKAKQHRVIAQGLLGSGDEVLVEDALHDPYWGWGASRVGENKLGRVYMAVRSELRAINFKP
jgi:predicted NAD-dependent protein-ADP-ribosyltransferase YbiA (DUF1768 family)